MTPSEPRRAGRASFWSALLAAVLTLAGCVGVFSVASVVLGPGMWKNIAAVLLAAAAVVPLHRWLSPRVHELAEQQHDPYEAVRSISSTDVHSESTAHAIAEAMNLRWVEVDTGDKDVYGTPQAKVGTVEIDITFMNETFGVIRTSERRPGSRLSQSDLHVLGELAAQLGMRLAAEEATAKAEEARAQLITAREEERRRIRRDLHDGLAPSLASIQLQLKAAQRQLQEDDPLYDTIGEMSGDVLTASADLRRLVYRLRPPLLDELGLADALKRQFDSVTQPAISIAVSNTDLPAAVEVAAFRIATEGVHNAIKHAGAQHVRVEVTTDAEALTVSVEDDGIGIRSDVVPGVGLAAMRERAEELGGVLTVESAAGNGTRVIATIGLVR